MTSRAVKIENVLTDRVKRLKEGYLSISPFLCAERSQIFTEYWKESEDEPLYIRRANAFEKILREMTIEIRDDDLIVGDMCKYRRGCNFYPESRSAWILDEIDMIANQPGNYTKVTEEEKGLILAQAEYWKDKNCESVVLKIWRELYGTIPEDLIAGRTQLDEVGFAGATRKIPNHPKIFKNGLSGVMGDIEEKLKDFNPITHEELRSWELWRGMIITCKAVINFAKRYSSLAKEMAASEKDKKRRRELEKISEISDRVPEKPPRTFWEALQCFWFIHIAIGIEGTLSGNSPGRFDQYMFPFYRRDIQNNVVTKEEVAELLACLWIKFSEYYYLQKGSFAMIVSGSPFQNMTIGGIKPEDGSDASNELSMLILDVTQHLKLPQPTVSVRYNDKLDEEFLLRAAEVISTGGGQPTFFNDKYAFSVLPYYGIPMEEVRDWAPTGCVEMNVPGTSALFWGSGYYAVPKIIELTMHNGFDPYIKKQVGPKTGEPETFDDFEKFWEAFNKQLEFINKITSVTTAHSYINVPADYAPLIFHSVLTDDCIERGKELHCGGPRHTSLQAKFPVGMMTAANSLTALKKLVFEDKELTLNELSAALEANFKGYEHIKKMCLEAPKYGNDDDYADEIAVQLFKVCNEIAGKNKNAMGENAHTGYLGITSHYYHGVTTGATPDGRLAGIPYGDGSISPVQGTDTKGPTAVIRSAGKIDAAPAVCTLFNQKFHPSALKNEDDWRKFISYFKTYFELGGYHIQFNCVDRELLLNAKAHPENYQDLVVRVSGFCHRFVELDSYVQDDIINRTEQRW